MTGVFLFSTRISIVGYMIAEMENGSFVFAFPESFSHDCPSDLPRINDSLLPVDRPALILLQGSDIVHRRFSIMIDPNKKVILVGEERDVAWPAEVPGIMHPVMANLTYRGQEEDRHLVINGAVKPRRSRRGYKAHRFWETISFFGYEDHCL